MQRFRALVIALAGATLVGACSDAPVTPRAEPIAAATGAQLDRLFDAAASEFNVPAALLKSVGYVETRWQMVRGETEFDGMDPAFGIMALRGAQLARGARLAGATEEQVRTMAAVNIRAAAALLSAYATEEGIDRADLGAWAGPVARLSGIQEAAGRAAYVHNDVYATLNRGVPSALGARASLAAAGTPVKARYAPPSAVRLALAPDYPVSGTIWRPSPNYNDRPTGDIGKVHMVIIHTCESGYTSCWSWLTNSSSGVSAHYVVKEDGSEISQLVYESKRAWHIGAKYYCSNNNGHDCWRDGYSSNHFTVGIEHGGYASQSSFPTSQISASAKLSCDISKAHAIPRDRYHYVAHGQLQPYNRTDPGPNWPWTDYMNRINAACGATTIIVDSNNNNNDTSKGYIEVSSNWTGSNATSGYYGTGYYYASTKAISDPATFWFYLPAAATKTIDAWWTAGSNRSSSAPFIAYNASGTKLGTVYANQQSNGGKWNQLGSYSFSAGWNKVVLSRWTTEGYVVIADAVRIR